MCESRVYVRAQPESLETYPGHPGHPDLPTLGGAIVKQQRLKLRADKSKTPLDRIRLHEANNRAAAELILHDRQKWEQECRFLVDWANRFLARLETQERQVA